MYKVRADIVFVGILLVLLGTVGSYFFPVERSAYKKAETSSYEVGMPADDTVQVVTTMAELEDLKGGYGHFAIKVDKDKLYKTDYYYSNSKDKDVIFKTNPVVMAFRYAIEDETHDRIYVAELEDGSRILVRIFERALDLSEKTITLPIGETKMLSRSSSAFEKIDEKYDLTGDDATKWYVDASGYWFRQTYLMSNTSTSCRNWTFVIIGWFLYAIASTIVLVLIGKRRF